MINSPIIPAILPSSADDLLQKLHALEGLSSAVQIDTVDGKFASPATWPASGGVRAQDVFPEGLPRQDRLRYEVDLMTQDPETDIRDWMALGATRFTLHAESTSYLENVVQTIQTTYGHDKDFAPGLFSIGIAINVTSDLSLIEPFLSRMDYVQFMGISRIGVQGQPFAREVLAKIRSFRKSHPTMFIQVDGGVSLTSAPELFSAGADSLIVGSALWKAPDLSSAVHAFEAIAQEYGAYTV